MGVIKIHKNKKPTLLNVGNIVEQLGLLTIC